MTRQEAFNIMVPHLLTQRCRATRNGICRYRGDDGTKCAVGVLITDEQYAKTMPAGSLEWGLKPVTKLIGMAPEDAGFLRTVQRVHDGVPIEDWEERLREIAADYNLTYPEVSDVVA